MYTFTWQFKIKNEQQSFIISLLFVWNSFIRKRNTAAMKDTVTKPGLN